MFGWGKKKPQADLGPEVKKIFEKISRFIESEADQNSRLQEPLKSLVLGGLNCDKIPGGHGDFGRDPTNPIPVNGSFGQILYLSQLRTASNSPVMFHRVGSTPLGDAEVDMYEVLSIDETVREYLWLSLYHPRKSRICPAGYGIERKIDFGNPIYGVNFLVSNFPRHLDMRIREWQMGTIGFPFSINEVRKYLYGSVVPNFDNTITWNGHKTEGSDASGLCFSCWSIKPYFAWDCTHCGRRPRSVDEMTYSIALSAFYYDAATLRKMSDMLMTGGKTLSMTLEQMDALRPAAFAVLDKLGQLR